MELDDSMQSKDGEMVMVVEPCDVCLQSSFSLGYRTCDKRAYMCVLGRVTK